MIWHMPGIKYLRETKFHAKNHSVGERGCFCMQTQSHMGPFTPTHCYNCCWKILQWLLSLSHYGKNVIINQNSQDWKVVVVFLWAIKKGVPVKIKLNHYYITKMNHYTLDILFLSFGQDFNMFGYSLSKKSLSSLSAHYTNNSTWHRNLIQYSFIIFESYMSLYHNMFTILQDMINSTSNINVKIMNQSNHHLQG